MGQTNERRRLQGIAPLPLLLISSILSLGGCQSSSEQESHSAHPLKAALAAAPPTPPSPAPIPPEAGETLLHPFVSREALPAKVGGDVTLTLVLGQDDVVSHGHTWPSTVVAKQRDRLEGFLSDLERGPTDEMRKRLQAWTLCVCPVSTRCQGGVEPCVRCTTCASMRGHGAQPAGTTWGSWPASPASRGPETTPADACPPKNVCVVVDVSGSMSYEGKLSAVKVAIKESLRHYMAGDVFSLVAFSDQPVLLLPPTVLRTDLGGLLESAVPRLMSSSLPVDRLLAGTPHGSIEVTLRRFLDEFDALRPGGQTDIREALILAAKTIGQSEPQRALLANPRALNKILLFSDGLHEARRVTSTELASFRALAKRIAASGASISTFGVGQAGFDEDLLAGLASAAGGSYYYVRDPSMSRELLWEELMPTPSVKAVKLTVRLAEGVRPLKPVGAATWSLDESNAFVAEMRTIPLEGKRARAIRLWVPPNAREAVATVTLDYRDTEGVPRRELAAISVNRGEALEPLRSSRQGRIAREEWILQETREALAACLERLDRSDTDGAMDVLRRQLHRLTTQWAEADASSDRSPEALAHPLEETKMLEEEQR